MHGLAPTLEGLPRLLTFSQDSALEHLSARASRRSHRTICAVKAVNFDAYIAAEVDFEQKQKRPPVVQLMMMEKLPNVVLPSLHDNF